MRGRSSTLIIRWVSLLFLLSAIVVLVIQLVQYSVQRGNYPLDMTIGDVPVGGLDAPAAAQRLLEVYSIPVELHYNDAIIQLNPALIGFELNLDSMLAAADIQRTGASFWGRFWDYLWNRPTASNAIPLVSTYSEQDLRAYLQVEVAPRYNQPAAAAQPNPGTADFLAGTPGQTIDIDRAVTLIDTALHSPSNRVVILTTRRLEAGRPSMQTLETMLKQIIITSGYEGLIDLYMLDLQSAESIHFAEMDGESHPVNPTDIAFTASSTIKIPIMISVYRHFNGSLDTDIATLVSTMIARSNNDATDELMKLIDEVRGPLAVSETVQQLGLENTFLAGYFYPGAFLLKMYTTPANTRPDIGTDPDIYSQTTPEDMGTILEDIYLCSQTGGGALVAAFPGQIMQSSCQEMIQYLQEDKLGALIQAGVPEGTVVAHKHGWVSDGGVMNHVSDAGIIFTPGGNFVLTIYTYHPVQVIWDEVAPLFADLTRATYNYFNIP